jgi:protein TonB
VLSAASHLAVIGVVTAVSTRFPARPAPPEKPVVVRIAYPTPPTPPAHTTSTQSASSSSTTIVPRTIVIDVPTVAPVGLPPIQPASGVSLDSLIIGSSNTGPKLGAGLLADVGGTGNDEWRGSDLMMRIVESSKPRYPEQLRQAGIGGTVLIRFTVDTLGRVDEKSVIVVSSTHELFANSARAALAGFRFRPAEVNGHRISALAEMPFEFQTREGQSAKR